MRMVGPIVLGLSGALLVSLLAVAILIRTIPTGANEAERVQLMPAGAAQAPLGQFVPASPPRPAPQVSFSDAMGASANLSDFAGKPVLLNLWATWCAPCRREMPSLERLQARLGDKITVLAISEDIGGNKAVAPFIAKFGLKAVKTYLDPKSTLTQAFNVDGLPTSFLIDRRGRVIGRVEGEAEWDSPKMLSVIEPLLLPDDIVKTSFPLARP
ncbi:MAG: TlpA disulfide reductase family protein [Stellaceae bacterium]